MQSFTAFIMNLLLIGSTIVMSLPQKGDWFESYNEEDGDPWQPVYEPGLSKLADEQNSQKVEEVPKRREWHELYPRVDSTHLFNQESSFLRRIQHKLEDFGHGIMKGFSRIVGFDNEPAFSDSEYQLVPYDENGVAKRQIPETSEVAESQTHEQFIQSPLQLKEGYFKITPVSSSTTSNLYKIEPANEASALNPPINVASHEPVQEAQVVHQVQHDQERAYPTTTFQEYPPRVGFLSNMFQKLRDSLRVDRSDNPKSRKDPYATEFVYTGEPYNYERR